MRDVTRGDILKDLLLMAEAGADEDTLEIVNEKLAELGIKARLRQEGHEWKLLAKEHVDPSKLGMMAPVFDSIELDVFAAGKKLGNGDVAAGIQLKYKWKHPYGSNGYDIQYTYQDHKWKVS